MNKRVGFLSGAALTASLLAGSMLASGAAAQTTQPAPGTGYGPRSGFGPGAGMMQRGMGPVGAGAEHAAVASALGVSSDELYTLRASGKSIAQIAQDKGVPLSKVTDAMLASHKVWLDQAVKDGRLTQAQADAMQSLMQSRIQTMVQTTGAGPHGMSGGRGGPGFGPRWGQPTQ